MTYFGHFGDIGNRLASVPVSYLIDRQRRMIPIAPAVLTGKSYDPKTGSMTTTPVSTLIEQYRKSIGWPTDVWGSLVSVLKGPTPDELSDLSLVDTFYSAGRFALKPTQDAVTASTVDPNACMTGKTSKEVCNRIFPMLTNQFFYPPGVNIPAPGRLTYLKSPTDMPKIEGIYGTLRVQFWDFDKSKPWSAAKRFIANMLTAERVMSTYPWPNPYAQIYWTDVVSSQLKQLIKDSAVLISDDDFKTFITVTFLQNWDTIKKKIDDFIQEKQRHEKRDAFIKGVAALAFGGMFLISGLSAALTSGVTGVLKGMGAAQQAGAAKDMVKAAKQLDSSNAAFASEIRRVANLLDSGAAAQQEAAPLSDEEKAAMAESPNAYIVSVEGHVVGKASTPEAAAQISAQNTTTGQRTKVLYKGQVVAVAIGTKEGPVPVDPKYETQVLSMSPAEVQKIATEAAPPPSGGGSWFLPVAAVAAALVLGKG